MNQAAMNQKISEAIKANFDKGMTADAAYDAVFGAGAYKKMAEALYDAFRAKAA